MTGNLTHPCPPPVASPSGASGPRALDQRIAAAAGVLLPDRVNDGDLAAAGADELLYALVCDLQADPHPERMWLVYAALATVLPDAESLQEAVRAFRLLAPDQALLWLMEQTLLAARRHGHPDLTVDIVVGGVLVEVDFSARHELHTGIQRVVRSLLPRWHRDHDIVPVVWTAGYGCLRTLAPDEADRALRWHGGGVAPAPVPPGPVVADDEWRLVLPWRSAVVLGEVPAPGACAKLAAVAASSGNAVSAIGYDCIPVVSAHLVSEEEPNKFVRFLSVVKHLRRVAAISVSATVEFTGFTHMLAPQGLAGPLVAECLLPLDLGAAAEPAVGGPPAPAEPTVLCVGSLEPRKNQLALLHVSEVLWREGRRFRLELISGGGWSSEAQAVARRLARRGRPVTVRRAVSEQELRDAFSQARFSVFPSLHEGYGLPVAESLALGTPAITTGYGSTREIGALGGTVFVDPRDDASLLAAMRSLLDDDDRLADLRAQIVQIPRRTWDDYAAELWSLLVLPELPDAA